MPTNDVDAINTGFRRALSDGSLTLAEAEDLIRDVIKDGVSQSERRTFREQVNLSKDRQAPDVTARLLKFISDEIPGLLVPDVRLTISGRGRIDDPKVLKEDKDRLKWEGVNGDVFVDGA